MRRDFPRWLKMSILGVTFAILCYYAPNAVSQLTYAVERGQSLAASAELSENADAVRLSDSFKQVAKSLRPSVVSISSVKRVQARSPQVRRFRSGNIPPEFERFFENDDTFERFFEMPSQSRSFEQRGLGTGVIVSQDGYIVTNNHVVEGADDIEVTLSDNRTLNAEIVGTDAATDVAVLKVTGKNLQPARWGSSAAMEVGDWVVAIGSPFGLDQTVTAGIVSAKSRNGVGITDYEDFIQTDAAINPGNSGGPLVNLRGEIVGINTAIASRTGAYNGIGFAIPSDMVQNIMQPLMSDGTVSRGYLGALIQDLDEGLASSFGYEGDGGVLIGDVVPGGPGDKAGLQAGDIVVKLDGKTMERSNAFRNRIASFSPSTQHKLEVFRDGSLLDLEVTVGKLGDAKAIARSGNGARSGQGTVASEFGLAVETPNRQLADRFEFSEDQPGAVVVDVEPGSAAAQVGIRPGDLIVSIGDQRIANAGEFRKALDGESLESGIRMRVLRGGSSRFVFIRSR